MLILECVCHIGHQCENHRVRLTHKPTINKMLYECKKANLRQEILKKKNKNSLQSELPTHIYFAYD